MGVIKVSDNTNGIKADLKRAQGGVPGALMVFLLKYPCYSPVHRLVSLYLFSCTPFLLYLSSPNP